MMAIKVQPCVFTLRLKVKAEAYDWLNAAATEVNQVWNYAKIGDVSSLKLAKTRMAKSVLDVGVCSRRNCSTRASRPAGALLSSVRETQREHAATAGPLRALQVWTCSL